jgi:hypothetical protein
MPTNADVFTTILSEVTGRPKTDVSDLLKAFRENNTASDKFDAEISQTQYDSLLAQLRTEKSGILNWLIGKGLHKP